MSFVSFGYNHDSAPAGVRDCFALDRQGISRLLATVPTDTGAEAIVLSTCNRSEVWLYGDEYALALMRQAWCELAGTTWQAEHAFEHRDEAAIRHVLRVTSGLESLVLGDSQILSQVKDAYRIAVDEGCVGTVLHRLMHTTFRAAKRVASETAVASGAASVSTAAVALARHFFRGEDHHDLSGKQVLVLGAGQMATLAVYALKKQNPASITICNRSEERGHVLAQVARGTFRPWKDRYEAIREVDLVIVATGAPEPILETGGMPPGRMGAVKLILDISSPRNVDPDVAGTAGYHVVDLDVLHRWIGQVTDARRSDLPGAYAICEELLSEFVTWMFHQQALQPAIQALRDTFEQIRIQEIERHHHRFTEIDREELDVLTRSILQKVLAIPIVRLKDSNPESLDFVRSIRLLEGLFARPTCEDDPQEEPAPSIVEALPACPAGLFSRKDDPEEKVSVIEPGSIQTGAPYSQA